ncbi:MAG: ABC transporter ATP-binding protein, partial [Caulobacterales bacterium]|nr:ABC transporter ATP-binding protein [Caulobacterales bacterium]
IVALIGANGAGKTTLISTICGQPKPRAGVIAFSGENIAGQDSHDIARLGVAIAPEGRRIFPRMSVTENLMMGGWLIDKARVGRNIERAFTLFPRLKERRGQQGGTLSGGEQQMLAISRALMSEPKLLLLDEPSLGLAPQIANQIFQALTAINRETGTTILLAEQDAYHALKIAARGYVLVTGTVALSGRAADLLADPAVRAAYLEGGAH